MVKMDNNLLGLVVWGDLPTRKNIFSGACKAFLYNWITCNTRTIG